MRTNSLGSLCARLLVDDIDAETRLRSSFAASVAAFAAMGALSHADGSARAPFCLRQLHATNDAAHNLVASGRFDEIGQDERQRGVAHAVRVVTKQQQQRGAGQQRLRNSDAVAVSCVRTSALHGAGDTQSRRNLPFRRCARANAREETGPLGPWKRCVGLHDRLARPAFTRDVFGQTIAASTTSVQLASVQSLDYLMSDIYLYDAISLPPAYMSVQSQEGKKGGNEVKSCKSEISRRKRDKCRLEHAGRGRVEGVR
eukprot:3677514-Pleurochrysis_carterae.AAC.1